MNSVFVNPGIYSCVVDAFLEISTICFYHMYQIYVLGMSLQTCLMFIHIIKSGGTYKEHCALLC